MLLTLVGKRNRIAEVGMSLSVVTKEKMRRNPNLLIDSTAPESHQPGRIEVGGESLFLSRLLLMFSQILCMQYINKQKR